MTNHKQQILNELRSLVPSDRLLDVLYLIWCIKRYVDNAYISPEELKQVTVEVAAKEQLPNHFLDARSFESIFYRFESLVTSEFILSCFEDFEKYQGFSLPVASSEVFLKDIAKRHRNVLIAEGERFAPILLSILEDNEETKFLIVTKNPFYKKVLENILADKVNVHLMCASIYEYAFINEKFDLILSVPAFGARLVIDSKQDFICKESEMAATENLLLHLSTGGTLLTVLPARIGYAAGKVKQLREFIQSNYKINEISELPVRFFSNIGIKTYFVSISTGITDDVAIKKYKFSDNDNALKIENDTFLMSEELSELSHWDVDKIFSMQSDDWQDYKNSKHKKTFLHDVAELFRGKVVSRNSSDNGKISVINISNINEFDIDYTSLDKIEEDERKVKSFILEDGDLLLTARGTSVKTGVFKLQDTPCIPSANLIVIRPKINILSSTYLKLFLDSDIGVKLIKSFQQGTSVMNISYRDLAFMEIPLPSFEEQDIIEKEYIEKLADYQKTITEAQDKWNATLEKLQKEL